MSNSRQRNLIIFIKNPEPGTVKTRLAKTIGNESALKVYHKLLNITRDVTKKVKCRRQLWYSTFIDQDDSWSAADYEKKLQQGNSLGARMSYSFKQAFDNGAGRAVIIGSDCAALEPGHIEEAFLKLKDHDLVIGPSRDGGYYLLGMSGFYPKLFEEKAWSTQSVFDDTVVQAQQLGLEVATLPKLNDIDTEEDLRQSHISLDKLN